MLKLVYLKGHDNEYMLHDEYHACVRYVLPECKLQ